MCTLPLACLVGIPLMLAHQHSQISHCILEHRHQVTVCHSRSYGGYLDGQGEFHDRGQVRKQLGFPGSSAVKESACNAEDPGSIPGSGRSTGEGIGYPFQHSGLENSMDCIVHGIAKSLTWVSDFHIEIMVMTNRVGVLFQAPFTRGRFRTKLWWRKNKQMRKTSSVLPFFLKSHSRCW